MANITLTGPGASVDRSGSNPLSWTWTPTASGESLHRWRLQYRVVGSGTWLNAVVAAGTNVLPNGSAESALSDWSLVNNQGVLSLARVVGGRHAGSGSWCAEITQVAVDPYDSNPSDESYEVFHPGPGNYTIAPVTPGGRYVLSAWQRTTGAGVGSADVQLSFRTAAGVLTGPSWYNAGRVRGSGQWDAFAADKVAPADAAYAVCRMSGKILGGVGATAQIDDVRLERVDNTPDNAVADATGNLWSFRYTGDPEAGQIVLTPNFLAAGNYEFRLEAWSAGTSVAVTQSYSNTVTSTMVTAAAAPTITTPAANGAVIPTNPFTVAISFASGQTQGQVRVLDNGGAVVADTGAVAISGTTASFGVPFPTNGVARTIQARTSIGGVWSSWATRTVTVGYTTPAAPTHTAAWEDTYALGGNHAVRITTTNPAPTGTQPAVTQNVVEWRPVGSTVPLVAGTSVPGTPLVWHAAPNFPVQVRTTAYGANGTTTSSAWATVTGTPAIRGVTIFDPANPSGIKCYRLNDDGVIDEESVESALLEFSGRQYPVAEFGAGTSRSIAVPLLSLRQDVDVASLKALLRARTALVYRDRRGRAVLARMSVEPVKDAFYGYTTGLVFDVLDSWGV